MLPIPCTSPHRSIIQPFIIHYPHFPPPSASPPRSSFSSAPLKSMTITLPQTLRICPMIYRLSVATSCTKYHPSESNESIKDAGFLLLSFIWPRNLGEPFFSDLLFQIEKKKMQVRNSVDFKIMTIRSLFILVMR